MRQLYLLVILLLVFLGLTSGPASALVPAPVPSDDLFFGDAQFMTTILRGNGDAIVLTKYILAGKDTGERSELTLTLPDNVSASNLRAFQYVLPPICLEYDYNPAGSPNCKKQGDPDYRNTYFYSDQGQTTYYAIEPNLSGQDITLTLPKPIAAQKEGGVILTFRTSDITRDVMGSLRRYQAVSLKSDQDQSEVVMAIDTDSELVIRGKKSAVTYAPEVAALSAARDTVAGSTFTSSKYDQALSVIGQGVITKTGKFLSPKETLTVRGSYASTWLMAYADVLLILLVVMIMFLIFVRRMLKNLEKNRSNLLWLDAAVGLGIAFVIVTFTFLMNYLTTSTGYNPYGSSLPSLLTLVSFIVYVGILGIPHMFIWKKFGWEHAAYAILFTIVWLIIAMVIFVQLLDVSTILQPPIYGVGGDKPTAIDSFSS